jgi:hypothetical protein
VKQLIEFIALEQVTDWLPIFDAYKFKPRGRMQWLQRVAWRLLHRFGALEQAMEPHVRTVRHMVDGDTVIQRLIEQRAALFDYLNKEGQRVIMGSEDYAQLMRSPEVASMHFMFDARVGKGREIMGLQIEVVPWVRGVVVMP